MGVKRTHTDEFIPAYICFLVTYSFKKILWEFEQNLSSLLLFKLIQNVRGIPWFYISALKPIKYLFFNDNCIFFLYKWCKTLKTRLKSVRLFKITILVLDFNWRCFCRNRTWILVRKFIILFRCEIEFWYFFTTHFSRGR